jgi:ABC-type cobalamin/Fe3+-siderophores transport system ATPase subunit
VSSGGSGGPLLAARGLGWHAAGRRILGPLELDVERGESVAIVGPNGAGKTTLLRLLAGLLAPSAGEVRLAGRPLASYSRKGLARRIAYVPQLRPIRVPLTVEAIVLLGRYPHLGAFQLAPGARDLEAVAEALRLTEIEHLRRRPVEELSGGERQSVYIAAALAQEAEILVLDEPTTHLDPRHEREIAVLLPRLQRQAGRTVLTATHDLNFASLTASRIVALKAGEILAAGRPAELLEPATLAALFEAPFEVVRGGERPMTLLRLEP